MNESDKTAIAERAYDLPNAESQEAFGAALGSLLPPGSLVYLSGDLGTGKTTLVRGLLRGRGFTGPVRSPTYTLMEPYEIAGRQWLHLDLYRLGDPEELEYLGLRDLLSGEATLLVEWPERGAGWLPAPDLGIALSHAGQGRRLRVSTSRGELLDSLSEVTRTS